MRHAAQLITKTFFANFDISEIINIDNNNKNSEAKNDLKLLTSKKKINLLQNDFNDDRLKELYAKLKIFLNQKNTNQSNQKLDSIPNVRSSQLSRPIKWFQDFVNRKFSNCLIYSHEKYKHQSGKNSKQNQFESTLKLFVEEMYKFNHFKDKQSMQTIKAIFPCLSMLNHSCDPNVILW